MPMLLITGLDGESEALDEGPVVFRVVRYLPLRRKVPSTNSSLRAGVGQAPREETAECATGAREGDEAMGIRAAAIELAMSTGPRGRPMT